MFMKLKSILPLILILVVTQCILAQNVEFTASAPKYVRVGEQFQIQFTVNASVDEFTPPSFQDFDYLGGPMQSTSTSSTWVNGKTSRVTTYSLIYYMRAQNPGKFKLEPAKATYKKSEILSNALEIEVVGTASQPAGSSSANSETPSTTANGEDVFVSLVLDKKAAFVGEPIAAWVKLYTKVSLSDIDRRNYKGPESPGFYRQDVEIPPLTNLEQEKVGNDIYYSGVVQKMILFPQKTGEIKIDPFKLDVFLQKQSRQSRSIIDEFFGPTYTSVQRTLTSKPVTVNVKSVPEPIPQGFTGAVGNYSLKGSLNSEQVRVNDAVTFKIVLLGTGNIKLVEKLNYDLSMLETYDPVVKTSIDKSGLGGTKVFEITAIPRHAGTYTIKPFELLFFDPVSKAFKKVNTQPFNLIATKTGSDSTSVIISNLSKEDVELLGSDIRYIKTFTQLKSENNYLIRSYVYYLVILLFLLLFILVFYFRQKRKSEISDVAKFRNRKASKIARKRLKKAHLHMKNNEKLLFYEELSRALWGYISDKLNIPVSVLSADKARDVFSELGIDAEITGQLLSVISDCEYARYAPGASVRPELETYRLAEKIILQIEQKL